MIRAQRVGGFVVRRAAASPDERGQTAVLIIGFMLVVALTVVVVVDATAAYLRRQALDTLADGAALAAADGLEGEQVYLSGLGGRAAVDPGHARALVGEYLDAVGATERFPGLSHRVETAGERVVVRVGAPLELPFPVPGVGDSTLVTATAAAVISVGD